MNEPISYQANPETRSTAPIQFFEADDNAPPAGTKATPRPPERPREVPPAGPPTAALQVFACEGASEAPGAKASPRPAGRERAVNDLSTPPRAPSTLEPGQGGQQTSE
jgi:hypothetical protein